MSPHPTRISPKGKAKELSNTLSSTCGQPESSDSDEIETKVWESRSRTWMAEYELKVKKCIQQNQSPRDPFQDVQLTSSHSSAHLASSDSAPGNDTAQTEFMNPIRGSLTRSEHSMNILASEADESCQISPARTQPPDSLPYLPPQLARPHSHQPMPASSQNSPPLPALAEQEQPEGEYYEHDTIVEDFSDVQLPTTKKMSTQTYKHLPILPKALVKTSSPGKRRLDHSTRVQSDASSSGRRIRSAKLSPKRHSKKIKEINTMIDYERLSRQERALIFPSVELFATFLNQSTAPKTKRSRTFLSGLDICYLLDPSVKQNFEDADRMRMTRLSAAGAKLHSQPKTGLTTHIIIGGHIDSWTRCTEALRSVISDSQELRSLSRLTRGPDDGQAGVDIIWLLSIRWLESCLHNSCRVSEKEFHIKPRNSRHANKPTSDFNTSIPSKSASS
ncbi:hypothetical protein DFH28DRAFT_927562 [Melampsora americana]|nr:hypothetical protein DFH28DRAFT_927562 [Melampsora americana]